MSDNKKHLEFIYQRLRNVYCEQVNVDYLLKLKSIIESMELDTTDKTELNVGDKVGIHFPNAHVEGEVLHVPATADGKLIIREFNTNKVGYVSDFNFLKIIS